MAEQNATLINMRAADGNIIRLECHDTLPSTAALAREYVKLGYPDRYIVFSERQSTSELTDAVLKEGTTDKGIFLSLILRPSIFPSQAALLGPISVVALANALEDHTSKKLGIGWVSSLYCDGRKIGGTAIEGKLDNFSSYEYIIVNFAVSMSEQNFPPRLTDMMRQVFVSENTSVPVMIAKGILDQFFLLFQAIRSPSKFMDAYRQRFILTDKKITVLDGQKKHSCRVIGIDTENGTLIVENKRGDTKSISNPRNILLPKVIKY